jgi:hypothetical protein
MFPGNKNGLSEAVGVCGVTKNQRPESLGAIREVFESFHQNQ